MLIGGLVAVLIFIAFLASARRSPSAPADDDWFVDEYLPLDPDLDGRIDN